MHRLPLLTSAALLALASGCASVGAPPTASALADFDRVASTEADGARVWRHAQASRFDAIHIDPAAIAFAPQVALPAEQQQELRAALVSALTERFAAAGLPSAQPATGRRTLAVRATVTAVELANPVVNVVTTLLLFAPLSRGALTVELEVVDAASGERVAGLVMTGKAGVENIGSAYSATGHARLQADTAAQRLVSLVLPQAMASAR